MTPARSWLCSHEIDVPDNHMPDRPFWRATIGLEEVDPLELWEIVAFAEATPAEQAEMRSPAMSEGALRNGHQGTVTRAMAKWKIERARRIDANEHAFLIADLMWLTKHQPDDPKVNWRKPVDIRAIPLPFT